MRRVTRSRRPRPDLIARPPLAGTGVERLWASLIIDPVHQLNALADLRDRGLISSAEFDSQRQRILAVEPDSADSEERP